MILMLVFVRSTAIDADLDVFESRFLSFFKIHYLHRALLEDDRSPAKPADNEVINDVIFNKMISDLIVDSFM